ncbi:MAG: aldo/keto reductase [Acidobacteriaceae bacterium]|nr:aldo/keto reductase [Acidobacteriaceae bacterium]MBV9765217.1 aldo/keto reductase [Acidobacteriaceae bacterium]
MHYRKLGATEAEVSEIGFGAWGIGGNQWQGGKDEESMRALTRAFELGVNFIDTALAYGDGHSEQLVGRAIREVFRKTLVATKIPPKNRIWPASSSTPVEDIFPYDYIIRCTEESLKNLGVEQIYLQQFHVWTDAWTHTEEWRRAIENLRTSGKVRYFGISISEHDPDSALEAIKTGAITAVQVIYNIFDQTPEKNLFPLCQERKIGVLARVPLDEGGLTGNITEDTQFEPGEFRDMYFRGDRKKQVVEHVEALKRDLAGVPGTLAEIALRFCLSHRAVTTVIPGMRRVATVESSCRAATAGMLDEKTLAILKRHAWNRNFYE